MIAIALFDDMILLYSFLTTMSTPNKYRYEYINTCRRNLGTRFKDHYDNPKNMIDVKGDPMLVASARSLKLNSPEHNFIFVIPENDFVDELEERLKSEFPECRVLRLAGVSQGAAETAVSAQGFFP